MEAIRGQSTSADGPRRAGARVSRLQASRGRADCGVGGIRVRFDDEIPRRRLEIMPYAAEYVRCVARG